MKPITFVKSLFRTRPSYILGRFYSTRKIYSMYRRMLQLFTGKKIPARDKDLKSEFVIGDITQSLNELHRNSYTSCMKLPVATQNEIIQFAKTAPLTVTNVEGQFHYSEVVNGTLPNGKHAAMGHCIEAEKNPAVQSVVNDKKLLSIVANYLGYVPATSDVRLYWSFVGNIDESERRSMYQTIDYHFDVHDYNFCYVHIYLTDCDENSGAHVLVKGSHKNKPISWLFGSARQTDQSIEKYYTAEKIIMLSGKAGEGFVEDTSCYHKALSPKTNERLMFQIRYH